MRSLPNLFVLAIILALGGCVLSVGRQSDGSHFAAHWIDLNANRKLADLIRANLENDPMTRSARLSVRAEGGNAYLTGVAGKPDMLARAVALALDTPGVESVRCELTVVK